jgi:hypothetical protein
MQIILPSCAQRAVNTALNAIVYRIKFVKTHYKNVRVILFVTLNELNEVVGPCDLLGLFVKNVVSVSIVR